MKNYKSSKIWLNSFAEHAYEDVKEQRDLLKNTYEDMRNKVKALVSRIGNEINGLTDHSIDHLDSLWDRASLIIEDNQNLNPLEAFLLGGSILLHDSAMTLAAYPKGLEELKVTPQWSDQLYLYYTNIKGIKASDITSEMYEQPVQEAINQIVPILLRNFHAKQAKYLAINPWVDDKGDEHFLIENKELRNSYGNLIGLLAESHWKDVEDLQAFKSVYSASSLLPSEWSSHPRRLACILRIADAIHIDHGRTPLFYRGIIKPNGISAIHWDFQEKIMPAVFDLTDTRALIFNSSGPFKLEHSKAWKLAENTIKLIDKELDKVNKFLTDNKLPELKASRIKGAEGGLTKYIEVEGWKPVKAELKISDTGKIIELLGGSKLYGEDYDVPLRELLQNGSDAIKARRAVDNRSDDWGTLKVNLETIEGNIWLSVQDTGIGMSENILTSTLIDFGRSFWNTGDAQSEFPGMMSKNVGHTGKFGIGFFSIFMLGNYVEVFSKRYDSHEHYNCLQIYKADKEVSDIILRRAIPNELLFCRDFATTVRVKLDITLNDLFNNNNKPIIQIQKKEKDISLKENLKKLLIKIAPATEVDIIAYDGQEDFTVIKANDWEKLNNESFLNKFWGNDVTNSSERVEFIHDDNHVYGRAVFVPEIFQNGNVLIHTVGGLLSEVEHKKIKGIIIGETDVVTRSKATHNIPEESMRNWATKQIEKIKEGIGTKNGDSYYLNMKVSELLYECSKFANNFGLFFDYLPIIESPKMGYLSLSQFSSEIERLKKDTDEIYLIDELHFDSDSFRDITQSDFEDATYIESLFISELYFSSSNLEDILQFNRSDFVEVGECYSGNSIEMYVDIYTIVK